LTEKLELVDRHRDEHGLNRCLRAAGVSKGTWHRRMRRCGETKQQARDRRLKGPLVEVVHEHPTYGYRRVQPELLEAFDLLVNHKRLRRVLNQWDLALPRQVSKSRPSGILQILDQGKGTLNRVAGWDPGPLEALSTDITEVRYADGAKKAHLMALIDIGSEWVPGWAVGRSADRELALHCWKRAEAQLEATGRSAKGLIVHQDQDAVFTSYAWLRRLLIESEALVSYSERGAKDNPWIESFWSHFKGENASLLSEAATVDELREVIDGQMGYYNERRRHSSVGYQSPTEYLRSRGIHVEPLAQIDP